MFNIISFIFIPSLGFELDLMLVSSSLSLSLSHSSRARSAPGQPMVSPDTKTVMITVRKLAFYFRLLWSCGRGIWLCTHRQSANIFDKIN